jgi:hypothetical protein
MGYSGEIGFRVSRYGGLAWWVISTISIGVPFSLSDNGNSGDCSGCGY